MLPNRDLRSPRHILFSRTVLLALLIPALGACLEAAAAPENASLRSSPTSAGLTQAAD